MRKPKDLLLAGRYFVARQTLTRTKLRGRARERQQDPSALTGFSKTAAMRLRMTERSQRERTR
jgi:hypothetical protein